MGYYLLDNKNPHGDHFYRSRTKPLVAIVIHCTAGLEDKDGGLDTSAERTARYAATTDRKVSWHSGSDADSAIELLPPGFTAFQCQGFNAGTYGHEISKSDMTWSDEPGSWVEATLRRAAGHLGPMARQLGVPIRKASADEVRTAYANGGPPVGFIGHAELDPSRRSDPGKDFPWGRFLDMMGNTQEEDEMTPVQMKELKDFVRAEVQGLEQRLANTHFPVRDRVLNRILKFSQRAAEKP